MKTRILAMLLVVAVGTAAWALYSKNDMEHVALSMLYLDSTTHIRNDVYVLSKLREGQTQDAITHLERLLDSHVATLEGCKFDLCAQSASPKVIDALQAAAAYKMRYQGR